MAWKYDAEEVTPQEILIFLPVHTLLLFVGFCLFIFFILFPKKEVINSLINATAPYPMAVIYLENLIQENPANLNYRISLANQEIGLGHWHVAKLQIAYLEHHVEKSNRFFQTKIAWLNFDLSLALTYNKKPRTYARIQSEKQAYHYLLQLVPITNEKEKLITLANAALGLNKPKTALQIYEKVLITFPEQTSPMLVQIAKVALMSGSYQLSGDLYFKAASAATKVSEKRDSVLLGLQSYQADGLYDIGFSQLKKIKEPRVYDENLLIFLTRYALAAGKPKLAEQYVTQVLALKYNTNPTDRVEAQLASTTERNSSVNDISHDIMGGS